MNPALTIITPAYNCARYLPATLESVKAQDYLLRHIVIDDGSTDETGDILAKYKEGIVVHHENAGEHRTINRALQMVETPYFLILNADDLLLPRVAERLIWFMDTHPKVLCAYPDIAVINDNGTIRKACLRRPEYDFSRMVRHHECLPSVGAIFRSEVIKTVGLRDPSFRWISDFDYWLRIGLAGDMCRIPAVLAAWRHRDGQESALNRKLQATERERLMDKFFGFDVPPSIRSVKGEAYAWAYLVAASITSEVSDATRYVGKAIRSYPTIGASLSFWNIVRTRVVNRA